MVSLNEKRSKTRYVIQTKTDWVDDDNKFGKRMLEKMGWQTGVGLGKNEDGRTEHIDMKYKANLKGVGFVNGKYDDTWIAHSQSFDSVLQQLNQSHPPSSSSSSTLNNVHQTIQQTKTRFNYKKQSSGKDLSSRSNNDLDCIFGWNKANQQQQEIEIDKDNNQPDANLYVTSNQSIQDYFKEKFRNKTKKQISEDDEELKSTKKKVKLDNPFSNSNLDEIEGYQGWNINSSFEQILKKKEKTKKKRKLNSN